MRAKTLLLTAALSVAILANAVAQTVYSVNAVGYVNVKVAAGKFALLANPLNQPTNNIAAVLPDVPVGTVVYVFENNAFVPITKRSATLWSGGAGNNQILKPGQGFFVKNAGTAEFTVTFVGEVPQGTNSNISIPAAGFNLLGSAVPQAGKIQEVLKLPAVANDVVYTFDSASQQYAQSTKRAGTLWTPSEPVIDVGQGFFYKAVGPVDWKRDFDVNKP